MTNASRYFDAVPTREGGVRLKLRHRFRDIQGTYLDPDGVARSRNMQDEDENGEKMMAGVARRGWGADDFLPRSKAWGGSQLSHDQDGSDKVEQTVHVASPPAPGQSYKLKTLGNGCVAMVLVSPPSELVGNTVLNNSGGTVQSKSMDRAAASFVAGRSGSAAQKLRTLNAINRSTFKR
jgi:hypothetical protein